MIEDLPHLAELWSHAEGHREEWSSSEIAELLFAGNVVGDAAHPGMPADLADYQASLSEEWRQLAGLIEQHDDEELGSGLLDVLRFAGYAPESIDRARQAVKVLGSMVFTAIGLEYKTLAQLASDQARVEAERLEKRAQLQPARARELLDQARELRAEARDWLAIAARPAVWS